MKAKKKTPRKDYPNISSYIKYWLDDQEIQDIAFRVGVTSYGQRRRVMVGKSKNHRLRNQWIEAAEKNEAIAKKAQKQ